MKQIKTFKDQMLIKYPNMNRVSDCSICGHDLRFDNKIHRIDMEWFCDKCYKKHKIKRNVFDELWDNPHDERWNDF